MIGIVERLRFDAVRTEIQFSKGVAANIEEGAAEIERLRKSEDENRYEAGMYKSLYDLWEKRATEYQGIICDLVKVLEEIVKGPEALARGLAAEALRCSVSPADRT